MSGGSLALLIVSHVALQVVSISLLFIVADLSSRVRKLEKKPTSGLEHLAGLERRDRTEYNYRADGTRGKGHQTTYAYSDGTIVRFPWKSEPGGDE